MENIESNNTLGLNTLSSTGTNKNRKRVGRGIGSGTVKQLVEVTKVKNQDQVEPLQGDLKVGKCLFNKEYQNLVFHLV